MNPLTAWDQADMNPPKNCNFLLMVIYSSMILLSIWPIYPQCLVEGVDIYYLMSSFLASHYCCIY